MSSCRRASFLKVDIPMDEIMYSTVTPDIVTMAFWTAFLTALFGSFIPAIRAAMYFPHRSTR